MPGSVTPGSVVLAPDSFKGTMTAATVPAALAEGVAAAGGRPVAASYLAVDGRSGADTARWPA